MHISWEHESGRTSESTCCASLENGTFGQGFPYGDLGEVLCTGRVDDTG